MTRHERLLENYEDAYFALLMEDVAQMEGARLDQLNMELQNDPHAAVPEGLTKRCLKTMHRRKFFFFTVRCYSRKPVSMRSLMKISFRNSV